MSAVVLRGDARRLPLPDAFADLIVTSPPFWQLRSYTDGGAPYGGQIGSEATPREYMDSLLDCTREWMRVLKPSGSLFVELGDKYSDRGHGPNRGNGTGRGPQGTALQQTRGPAEKSLLDLPHRYVIRCMDELGLILRAEIIWHHVNGLPESATDRVRRMHSAVFHFTKQPRYFAAMDEVREPHNPSTHARGKNGAMSRDGQSLPTWGLDGTQSLRGTEKRYTEPSPLGKMPGSVWDIPSQPLTVPASLGVDHFAAFPMELPRRIILGWSPSGICTACGEGRRPVTRVTLTASGGKELPHDALSGGNARQRGLGRSSSLGMTPAATITGYACACPDATAPVLPAVVVDPFGGTGTTALVAAVYGRTGVTVDRSADYCRLARWRTRDPAERARALGVPKPPPVPDGQASLFDEAEAKMRRDRAG